MLIGGDFNGLGSQLDELGIAWWDGPAALTLDDTYRQIAELGAATGHSADADTLISGMQSDIDAIVAATPIPPEPLTFFHEIDDTLFSVDSTTFIGELYSLLGLRNIADTAEGDSGGYPQLSAEFVVSADPDLIFLADTKCCGQSLETVAARPGWAEPRRRADRQRGRPRRRRGLALGSLESSTSSSRCPTPCRTPRVDGDPTGRRDDGGGRRTRGSDASSSANRRWYTIGAVILVVSIVLGASIGPGRPGLVARSVRAARPRAVDLDRFGSHRRPVEHRVAYPDAAGDPGRARRGDALGGGRQLPGRVPQSARRPLPARCRPARASARPSHSPRGER